ncbi:hypothetical protein Tco_1284393 [Tanacetum coccineum]
MLAPKCSTYNGRPTFANPRYLKKAQSEKPCLYEIPYDNSDHANRFAPDREETMTLANESRSKLNKDYVKQMITKTEQEHSNKVSELKLIKENCKGKSVETQFDKPSVVRQPNAQRIPKPSVLGKPTPFSNSPEMRSFQTKQSVNKTNVSDGLFKQVTQQNLPKIRKQAVRNTNVIAPGPSRNHPKHVSFQSPKEFVGSNDMVHNYYLEKAKKSAQLQKDKDVNGKPSMINPARLPNTANGCKPKPRNWQASMSSRVSNKDVHIEGEHRKQKPFLKSNDLRCPTCKKCLFSANHDECVLEYLSKLNPRASAQNKDAKSHKTTKRYMPVEKTRESKRPERQIPSGHRFSKKKTTTVPEKTMTPRSCLRWKQTGKIFKTVGLRWVPTGKLFNSCTGKVDSEPTHGSIVDIPHIHACKQTLGLSAGTSFNGQKQQRIDLNADALYNAKQENLRVWLLKMLISKKPVPECSDLAPQRQMVSAKNNTSGPGRMPTKIELTLEQSQQGVSNDVLVSIEGVEELKRNVWIKGVKKEALHTTLGRNRVNTYAVRITMLIADIEDDIMDPCVCFETYSGDSLNLPDHSQTFRDSYTRCIMRRMKPTKTLLDTYGIQVNNYKELEMGQMMMKNPPLNDRVQRRMSGKEPASTVLQSEMTTKTAGKTTNTGTKTHTKSASQSAPVGDAMHTT